MVRLAFMGTPDFAVPSLTALIDAGHTIAAVYTQPPRPAGRGKKPRKSPVQLCAERQGLPVRTPDRLKAPAVQQAFADLALDAAVVAAYGLILPRPILAAPTLGCVNVHASLLPRWRGAAPIARAIMAGDQTTGVCIMKMAAGLDTGPVIACRETPIREDETAQSLHDRLAILGAETLVPALEAYAAGDLVPQPQPDTGVTYADKIDKAEARIDWTQPAERVDCQVRGLSPFPGAWTELNGTRLKLLMTQPVAGAGAPGEVLDDTLTLACGQGALRVISAQRPGKGPMAAADLLRGFQVQPGDRAR